MTQLDLYGGTEFAAAAPTNGFDLITQMFTYEGHTVRTLILGGEPWFVGNDACAPLGIVKPDTSLALLDDDEKDSHSVGTPGGNQVVTIISESGLYSLILRSRRPRAKQFKRWITHEVLPALRKAGTYSMPVQRQPELDELEVAERYLQALKDKRAAQAEAATANAIIAELEPKAAQADQHRSADGLLAIGDFANELKAWAKREHQVKVKHDQVWNYLGELGLLIRGNTIRHNQRTAFAADRDLVRMKTTDFETNHGAETNSSPRLTIAGEAYVWDRAVKRIATTGTLNKPQKAIGGAS